jgi:hypothetical protein
MTTAEGAPAVGQTLRRIAQELREYPERWAKGEYAFNAAGELTEPTDPAACKWCLMGLLDRDFGAYGSNRKLADSLLRDLVPDRRLIKFNDAPGRTALEVADLFDRAAEKAGL